MSFTTLPIPQEDYIYGSNGNDSTCKAQGFFIQMGTIACLLGVSLAFYYNFVIKHGWRMTWMDRNHINYYLLLPPLQSALLSLALEFCSTTMYSFGATTLQSESNLLISHFYCRETI
jgi:hypothetical protein